MCENFTITFTNNGIPNALLGVAPIEYQAREGSIKVARRNTIVYKVGVVPT